MDHKPVAIVPESHEHWLQLRSEDLTSTEIPALFDMSPYLTEYELYHYKTGSVENTFAMNERMEWGLRLEEVIAKGVAEELELTIRKVNRYVRHGIVERMGSSFDFEIVNHNNGPGILEVKNVDALVYKNSWKEDEAPEHIEMQVQHQMEVMNREWCLIAVLVGGNQIKYIERKRDHELGDILCERTEAFWADVYDEKEPDPNYITDIDFLIQLHNHAGDEFLNASGDETIREMLIDYRDIGRDIKNLTQNKDAIKVQILEKVGDVDKVLCDEFSLSCNMTKGKEPEFVEITADMVGEKIQISGGRKPFRQFRLHEKKA